MPASTSSAENIRIAYIKEVTPGTTPAPGNFKTFRKTTESLSGDPQVKESQESVGDGQPTGQIQTGLDVKGDLNGELAPTISHQDFIAAAMRNTWGGTITTGALSLTINTTAKTIARVAGSFVTDGFKAFDFVQLANFANAANNTVVQLLTVSALSVTYISDELVNEAGGSTTTMVRPNYVEWGSTDSWFSISKDFTDLTSKSITYTGDRVSTMSLDFKYGDIATVKFGMAATGYDPQPATPITQGRTVDSATTELALNASSDLGTLIINGALTDYCIEGLNIALDNKVQAVNSVGHLAPQDQKATGLKIDVTMDIYLTDSNFDLHKKKISQAPIDVSYYVSNAQGGYAVRVPAVQLSFPDAAGGGKGTLNKLSAKGMAKKDATMGNTIRIYKF